MDNEYSEEVKKYYTIGEIAARFTVAPSLIRYWEKQFKQLNPQKSKNGVRKYTLADLKCFELIYHLIKKEGYTIKGAQAVLPTICNTSTDKKKKLDSYQATVIKHLENIKKNLFNLQKNLSE